MESQQLRLMAALTIVLLGMTAALWFGGEPTEDPFEPEATIEVNPALDVTKAVSLRIVQSSEDRDTTLELSKRDGVWFIDAPFEAESDPGAVIEALDAVRESVRGIPVTGDPEAFGLDAPQVTATVGLEDGSERVLVVGDVAADGIHTYVRAPDGSSVAVSGRPGEALLKRPNEYRDHLVFRYSPGDVERIAISSALGDLEAVRSDAGWFLTGYSRVDLDALDNWVVDFLNLRVDLFLDLDAEKPEAARYTVEVQTADGVQTLYVGRDTPYGPLIFFRDGLNGTMDPGLLRMFERGPTDVGVADAFPFGDEVQRVVLTGARDVSIQREGDGWAGTPDAEAIASVLEVSQLTYKPTPPNWSVPELTVRLEGDRIDTIEVGPEDPEGFRAVRDTAGGTAVRVPIDELEALFGPPGP